MSSKSFSSLLFLLVLGVAILHFWPDSKAKHSIDGEVAIVSRFDAPLAAPSAALPSSATPTPSPVFRTVQITYDGIFEGSCRGRVDDRGVLRGQCVTERILGKPPQNASFGEPVDIVGKMVRSADGVSLSGTIDGDIEFDGLGHDKSASGRWTYAGVEGRQQGGIWRAEFD